MLFEEEIMSVQRAKGVRSRKAATKHQLRLRSGGEGLMARITAHRSRYVTPLWVAAVAFSFFVAQGLFNPNGVSAAITYQSTETNGTAFDIDLTIDKPDGTAKGDVLIANFVHTSNNSSGDVAVSSEGWNQVSGISLGTTSVTIPFVGTIYTYRRATVLWKVAGESEPPNYEFTISGASDSNINTFYGAISTFRCVDTSGLTPFDIIGDHQANNSQTITAPGITTNTDNAMLVFLAQETSLQPFSSWTTETAGDLTEIYDSGATLRLGAAILTLATAGATGDGTAQLSLSAARNGGLLIALKPLNPPTAGNNGPICEGEDLNLTASPTISGATYDWTGPNGFTSTDQNPTIEDATPAATGEYSVTVTLNGCTSEAGTTDVTVKAKPAAPTAGNNGPICEGEDLNLTASAHWIIRRDIQTGRARMGLHRRSRIRRFQVQPQPLPVNTV